MFCGDDSSKYLNDPIYGHIKLQDYVCKIIDTPQFQRLRYLKQLGTTYFVFPGAVHTRFEHCIGVSHLANTLVTRLRDYQPELGITERDIKCVTIAGLCHDLGHGPFSHVFEYSFMDRLSPSVNWSHENSSETMLEYLISDNKIESDKLFLFDIVSNQTSGADVDKFDFILRDCYYVGLKSSYDCSRLILSSRVIDQHICYEEKEYFNVYELFHTRYTSAIEFMLTDAMLKANEHLEISKSASDPKRFLYLTDGIIEEIAKNSTKELESSRSIIHKMKKRNLYKLVSEALFLPLDIEKVGQDWISPEKLCEKKPKNSNLNPNDIRISWNFIHFGKKKENPVDYVNFYTKKEPTKAFRIPINKKMLCYPTTFGEHVLRIFVCDSAKMSDCKTAFENLITSINIPLY
ncbi:hypothetical protein BB558_002460 [Smittium angustum]|uniref:HD/PDEase domain-containing protein n=1 Tax=Smittium angustum TaxID=133377 RepID=A0A2U1J8N9_SMIAN|nr:hypothetical protein BB558_002460 [Smittium angustum]